MTSNSTSWSPVPGNVLTTWKHDSCEWNPPKNCHIQLVLSTVSYTASHLCTSLSSIDKELVVGISRWLSLLLFLLAPKMLQSMSRLWNCIFSSISFFVFKVIWTPPDFQIRLCTWFIYFTNTLTKKILPSASMCAPSHFWRPRI